MLVTSLPAGTAPGCDTVHALDSDGGSLCAIVRPGGLHPLDSRWSDPVGGPRCVACAFLMTGDPGAF